MKRPNSILWVILVACTFFSLIAGEFVFDLRALAQKTCINKDGTQTTTEPDNTYGEGGTKETVKDGNGRIIKVVKKDKEGKPRISTTYFCGNKECGSDAVWVYDDKGRLVSFRIEYTETPFSPGGTERRTIKYAGDDDTKGTSTDETLNPKNGEWKPASASQSKLIDSTSGPDPVHDYSPDKPESIIGDLGGAGSKPSPSPSPSPARLPKFKLGLDYKFDFKSSDGLKTETFILPSGTKISANFPADLSAGDMFTGTLRTELAGKDEKLRARSQAELDKCVLVIGGQPAPATDNMFTRTIPSTVNVDEPYLVLMQNGAQVCSATVPIAQNPPAAPSNPELPTCGQMGRNVVVMDHCDGIIAPTDSCSIGGTQLPPLAESPRMRVMQNTSQVPGQTEIKYSEQGKEVSGPFQNLGVKLMSPNTNLLRGQKTTLEVVALVQGIQQDVSLDLVNDTPGIVSISGGDSQHFTIHPADVQADGTYHQDFTVTATQPGTWGATATVSCVGGPQAAASPAGAAAPGAAVIPIIPPTPTPTPGPPGAHPSLSPTPSPSPSPCAPTPSPTTYSVKNLGPLSASDTADCIATGVNEAGNVIGVCGPSYFGLSGGSWRAFRTKPGAVIDKEKDNLGFPTGASHGGADNVFATGINAGGDVVGFWSSGGAVKAFFWSDGSKMINLHSDTSIFTTSKAFAVNAHDDVVGAAYGSTVGPVLLGVTFDGHAVIWPGADPKKMKDLNEDLEVSIKKDWILKAAFDINDDGDIVGRAYNKKLGKDHAFLLKGIGGKFFDLGALKEDKFDSSAAYAISACGEKEPPLVKVAGYTYTTKDYHYGFVWTEDSGLMDMGTLPPYSSKPDLLESFAQSINKKGEVVGAVSAAWHTSPIFDAIGVGPGIKDCVPNSHAVWYNGSDLKDLNKLIPDSSGWELDLANEINDKGLIAGSGFYKCFVLKTGSSVAEAFSHLSHAVLLTPVGLTPPGATETASSCPLALAKGYIFDNWNICGVKNGPTKETTFTIDKDYLITFIATYHWNDGKGALPGKKGISVKDSTGKVFGPWTVITSAGSGGKANVNWECHPGIALPAETYTVVDPDPATWSHNDGSGHKGFTRVAGYPVKK